MAEPVDPPDQESVWKGEIDYDLPRSLIAQRPTDVRDESRLMVLDRGSGSIAHRHFRDLKEYVSPRDVLVANDSRVFPARLYATKNTGGRVELLVLDARLPGLVTAMARSSKSLREDQELRLADGTMIRVVGLLGGGRVSLDFGDAVPMDILHAHGELPLPPYIERPDGPSQEDLIRYQTVFGRTEGSVAAPTAGLHFTQTLLSDLSEAGVGFEQVTLHVGPGTFAPVRGTPQDHTMDAEFCSVSADVVAEVGKRRAAGGRSIAVGTTSVRTLESAAQGPSLAPYADWTSLFIRQGHDFRAVDALITNFHLPGSTLLCLVMAFAGEQLVRKAYCEAIARRYRFYSYGDAMLIV
jgi:S-adenosylmethionine:tRNA ribosyltransferase-isomerase